MHGKRIWFRENNIWLQIVSVKQLLTCSWQYSICFSSLDSNVCPIFAVPAQKLVGQVTFVDHLSDRTGDKIINCERIIAGKWWICGAWSSTTDMEGLTYVFHVTVTYNCTIAFTLFDIWCCVNSCTVSAYVPKHGQI